MYTECRNCGVLKAIDHKDEKKEEECLKALGRKYGYIMPNIPAKSLWVLRDD